MNVNIDGKVMFWIEDLAGPVGPLHVLENMLMDDGGLENETSVIISAERAERERDEFGRNIPEGLDLSTKKYWWISLCGRKELPMGFDTVEEILRYAFI